VGRAAAVAAAAAAGWCENLSWPASIVAGVIAVVSLVTPADGAYKNSNQRAVYINQHTH
jgi:hypothetical protein